MADKLTPLEMERLWAFFAAVMVRDSAGGEELTVTKQLDEALHLFSLTRGFLHPTNGRVTLRNHILVENEDGTWTIE